VYKLVEEIVMGHARELFALLRRVVLGLQALLERIGVIFKGGHDGDARNKKIQTQGHEGDKGKTKN